MKHEWFLLIWFFLGELLTIIAVFFSVYVSRFMDSVTNFSVIPSVFDIRVLASVFDIGTALIIRQCQPLSELALSDLSGL